MSHLKEPPAALHPAEPLLKYTPVIKVITEEPRTPAANAPQPPSVVGILCRCFSLCTLGLLMSIAVCLLYVNITAPNMDGEGHPGLELNRGDGTLDLSALNPTIMGMPAQQQAQLFDPLDDLTLTFMFHGAAIDSQPFSMCNDSGRVQRGDDIDGEAFITYRTQPGIASFRVHTFFFNPLLLTGPQQMEARVAESQTANLSAASFSPFEPFSFLLGDSIGGSWDNIPVEYQQIETLPSGFERGVYVPSRQLPSKDLLKVVLNDVPQDSWRAQVGDVFILSL